MLLSTSARRPAGLTDDELAEIIERGRAQLAAPVIEASVVEDGSTGEVPFAQAEEPSAIIEGEASGDRRWQPKLL